MCPGIRTCDTAERAEQTRVREERGAPGCLCPSPKVAAAPILPRVVFPQPLPPEPGFRTVCPSHLCKAVREYSMTNVMGSWKLTGWTRFLLHVDIFCFRREGPFPCELCHFL